MRPRTHVAPLSAPPASRPASKQQHPNVVEQSSRKSSSRKRSSNSTIKRERWCEDVDAQETQNKITPCVNQSKPSCQGTWTILPDLVPILLEPAAVVVVAPPAMQSNREHEHEHEQAKHKRTTTNNNKTNHVSFFFLLACVDGLFPFLESDFLHHKHTQARKGHHGLTSSRTCMTPCCC